MESVTDGSDSVFGFVGFDEEGDGFVEEAGEVAGCAR